MVKKIAFTSILLSFFFSTIGCKTIPNAQSSPKSESRGITQSPVGKIAGEWYNMVNVARNDYFQVVAETPLDMIKTYITKKHETIGPEIGAKYTYLPEARQFEIDKEIAGIFKTEEAKKLVLNSLLFSRQDDEKSYDKISAFMDKLMKAGATFGFDGFEQNGCASPTAFLLIIDQKGKQVIGIDLNPCDEG